MRASAIRWKEMKGTSMCSNIDDDDVHTTDQHHLSLAVLNARKQHAMKLCCSLLLFNQSWAMYSVLLHEDNLFKGPTSNATLLGIIVVYVILNISFN